MPVILLMLLGYILKRINFFNAEFLKFGNKTVFFILLPILLFKNIADINDISQIRMDVIVYVLIIIVVLVFIGFLSALLIDDSKQKGVIHQCIFRSNFALIGVPLAELMGGSNGVVMAAVISLFSIPIFNVLAVIVLSVYKDGKIHLNPKKILLDIVKNPLIIGVLSGLVVALVKFKLADYNIQNPFGKVTFIYTIISYLARAATPLSLIVLGGQFDLQRVFGYKKQLVIGLIGRNIIAPLLGVGIAVILSLTGKVNFGPDVYAAIIALFGTPVAVASAIMAEAMDNDGQLAGQLVVWTSLFSLISLFVVIFIVRALGLL
ncbi:MAG: AEC family transporter [Treponema sp.]|nr:AEC family transporter [Treponema sp.]